MLSAPLAWLIVSRRVLTQLDLAWFNLPIRHLYREALRAGDSIWWTPSLFSGYFVHGDGQGGAAHPLHLLLYRWLPLDVAFNLEMSASYAFGFAGMLVLQRRLGISHPAAVLGAILFSFGGFNLMHLNHMNAVAVMAHAPWMFAAIDVMLGAPDRGRRLQGACGYAALLGSQILLGYPQYVWMSVLGSAVFAAARVTDLTRLALLPAAAIAGGLIGAAQLVPNIAALRESSRGSMDPAFAFSFSLHPWNLFQLWSPYAFVMRVFHDGPDIEPHELALYNGAFCTAAVAWLLARRDALGARRRLATALLAGAALFLVLALGKYGGLYWLVAHLPVVRVFRAPTRYIAVFQLFLALIGALAFDDLVAAARGGTRAGWRRLWPLGAIVALSGFTLLARFLIPPQAELSTQSSSLFRLAAGLTIVTATVALMILAARGARWAPALLIPIAACDLGVWGWAYAWRPPPVPLPTLVSRIRVPRDATPPFTLYQAVGVPSADLPVLRGFRMFNGYVGMWPVRVIPYENAAAQRLGGAMYRHDYDGWRPIADPMPRARLIADVRVSADPARDVDGIDISRTALVGQPLGAFQSPAGEARVVVDRPGRLDVEVHAGGRQLLVMTERFHSGWRATVDGMPADTVAAYGDQLAAVVDAGSRRVEFRFSPRSVRVGVALTLVGCVMVGAALIAARHSWGAADG